MESGNHTVYSSRTSANKTYTSFKWCLEDYSTLHTFYQKVDSPEFKICQSDESCIMRFNTDDPPAATITVYVPTKLKFHTIKVQVSITDNCDQKIITDSSIRSYPLTKEEPRELFVTFVYVLITASELLTTKKYLYNDTLRLLCEITVIHSVNVSSMDIVTQGRCVDNEVRDKFKEFYKDEQFTDVTLCVNDTKFRAHKVILAAASPVFEAMFKTSMSEQADNEVIISDTEPAAFEAFLKTVYSGSLYSTKNHVVAILIIADKYQIMTIKNLCEKYMKNNLNSATVIEYLLLAHSHGFNDLKKHALAVAVNLRKELHGHLNFKELCHYPEIVSEIFQKVTESASVTARKTTKK